jgi:ANTAR domain-containing protein/GAF domain-containing protein
MTASDDETEDLTALAELAEAFTALVEALLDGQDGHTMPPARIVELATRCMPRGRHVALVISEDGSTSRSLAATSDLPARVDELRTEVGQGPALDVLETNDLVVSNDIAVDPRWPMFGPRVVDRLGIHSTVAYRLYLAPRLRAALVLYSDWPHAFDDLTIATGSIFASYCSLAVITDQLLGDRLSARRAREVHREIGVAVGLLMAAEEIGIVDAYRRLVRAGRNLRRTLPDLAHDVIQQRSLPVDGNRPTP